jgi:hypothetical protein
MRFLWRRFFFLVQRIERTLIALSTRALQRFHRRNQRTRNQHQLEIQRSSDVLDRRNTGVYVPALEVRNLSLAQAALGCKRRLAQLSSEARGSEDVR